MVCVSLYPRPSRGTNKHVSAVFKALGSRLFSLPDTHTAISKFGSPSYSGMPSEQPFAFGPVPECPFGYFSAGNYPSSGAEVSSRTSVGYVGYFLKDKCYPAFGAKCSRPSKWFSVEWLWPVPRTAVPIFLLKPSVCLLCNSSSSTLVGSS